MASKEIVFTIKFDKDIKKALDNSLRLIERKIVINRHKARVKAEKVARELRRL